MKEEGQEDRSRANYQIRSRSFGLSPRYRSALQSSRFVGWYDLNVEFGNPRIIAEAAKTAINLVGETRRIFNRKTTMKLAHDNFALVMMLATIIKELRDALNAKGACDDPNN